MKLQCKVCKTILEKKGFTRCKCGRISFNNKGSWYNLGGEPTKYEIITQNKNNMVDKQSR